MLQISNFQIHMDIRSGVRVALQFIINIKSVNSPVENKNDLELDFKVFFFTDSCCSDIVHDESN